MGVRCLNTQQVRRLDGKVLRCMRQSESFVLVGVVHCMRPFWRLLSDSAMLALSVHMEQWPEHVLLLQVVHWLDVHFIDMGTPISLLWTSGINIGSKVHSCCSLEACGCCSEPFTLGVLSQCICKLRARSRHIL